MTATQPSLLDLLDAPRTAFNTRLQRGELVPGEPCPACGQPMPIRWDCSGDHFALAPGVCVGMALTARHLALDIRAGVDPSDSAARAVTAGWPASTVEGWLVDPTGALEVTA